MPFDEDLSPFFADFDTDAVFDGAATPVKVIFDRAAERSLLGELGMATTSPAITLPSASVPAGVEGQGVTVMAAHYTVAEHQPDGTGISTLFLTKG